MCRFFPILPVTVLQFIEGQETKLRIYANIGKFSCKMGQSIFS